MGGVCCGLGLVFDFGVLWFVLGGFRFAGFVRFGVLTGCCLVDVYCLRWG